MFENLKKIIVKGGCFENETELEIFKKYAVSVVYGRNGSGKTTIAHCIDELVKPDEEKSTDYTVRSEEVISDEKKQSVFIFNEDFVREQVRVEKDGINTIVMLGEQVELDEQIAKKRKEQDKLAEEYVKLDELRKKIDNAKENISPLYFFNQIRDALRADDGWAEIDRQLKGNKVMSRITDDVINNLINLEEPTESYELLRERVMSDLRLYQQSENAQAIEWEIVPISLPDTLDELRKLLIRPLDSPALSEREQRLVTSLAMHPHHFPQETRQMIGEKWTFCPLCLREISEDDKSAIIETLKHILNREADEFDAQLSAQLELFAAVETRMPAFSGGLNEQELNAAQTALSNMNNVLQTIREKISQRKRNIYEVSSEPFDEETCIVYRETYNAWKNALDVILKCVEQFNDSVNKRKKLYERVRQENNLLARKQLSALLLGYKQAIENSNKNNKDLKDKSQACETVENEIKALQQKKENTDIALDYINKELQYVFYSKRKVKLEPGDGCYKLKINGRNVTPKKISVGERNVLGLCYFFAKLFSGKTETNKYASEYLLVIDDPVSSFDYGNRIGVMSLLRFQFGNIIKGNASSRILVLSHDLHSVFDLVKIRNEVLKVHDSSFMELANNKLDVKRLQNEYKKLLEYVYDYATSNEIDDIDETQEMSIGNIMRRVMEAFSSFCYNVTFEEMVRKEDVLAIIPESKRSYYANFMGRLTLNTESHMAESVYTLDTITACFTKDEKVQTAKSLLLFLFHINRPHLSAYMDATQLTTIEGWQTEEDRWLVE